MTPVGHIITGAAIGIICLPKGSSKSRALVHVSIFVFLANIPDLALPSWGHEKYAVSHSVFVNLLLISTLLLAALTLPTWRQRLLKYKWTSVCGVGAWMSHFLLDSFYNHGHGIAIFWPFSAARLVLPIPWLATFKGSMAHLTFVDLKVFAFEVVTFCPLLIVALTVRRQILFGSSSRKDSLSFRMLQKRALNAVAKFSHRLLKKASDDR